jgi:hypothetical protein
MKIITTTLLVMTLCAPVWAVVSTKTIHGIHEGCELRSKQDLSGADAIVIGWIQGYIVGYEEATPSSLHGTPETQGEIVDAVCKYIDLHPEIWSLSRPEGLDRVLQALYGGAKH